MNEYYFYYPITGTASGYVLADSKEEALQKIKDSDYEDIYDVDYDFDYDDAEITSSNER